MPLAIFDLDNTLIGGDSDYLWGEFLVEQHLVEEEAYRAENDRFYRDYQARQLDILAYLTFALTPLAQFSPHELGPLHNRFMREKIDPIQLPKARELVEKHRRQGDTLMVITATNRFITEPIVATFNIPHLLASEAEIIDGRYTGRPTGIPCYQGGKVQRLETWLKANGESLRGSYFYSDSANDIPLLDKVDYPVAVDPDPALRQYAEERSVPVLSLRENP